MFNNWFKSDYLKNENIKYINNHFGDRSISNNIHTTKIISKWNNFIFTSIIHSYYIKFKKTRRFFSFNAIHSKKIAEIILNRYGDLGFLGSVYELKIDFPNDPKFSDKGLVDKHLKTGYPNILTLKNEAYDESKIILKEIQNIKKTFEEEIDKLIQSESHWKWNIGISDLVTEDGYYYFINNLDNTTEIFKEIKNGRYKRQLNVTECKTDRLLYAHFETDTNKMLMSIKTDSDDIDIHKKEFERIITLLIESEELKNLVIRYNGLIGQFNNNVKKTNFRESIKSFNEAIIVDNTEPKGSCQECKLKKWIPRLQILSS